MKHERNALSTSYGVILGVSFFISQILYIDSLTSTISSNFRLAYSLPKHQKCCLLASSTENESKSSPTKHIEKSRKTDVPTARYLAVAALASRPRGSNEADSTAFASRRLDMDKRYELLEPRDRSFSKLLVVS